MILLALAALAAPMPTVPPRAVREMIREAKAHVVREGEDIWPGFKAVPFHLILVTAQSDFLFCQVPTDGFHAVGTDPISGCSVQRRKRRLAVDSSASFDVAGDRSMIVMGMPKALGLSRVNWILTLIHEAFHQYQNNLPGYVGQVEALGLRKDSRDARWMLDFPFPYGDPAVGAMVTEMASAGAAFLQATSPEARAGAIAAYVKQRRRAMRAVTADQWRYYEFQIGQEGIARWTELAIAIAASRQDRALAGAATDQRLSLIASLRSIGQQGVGVWKRSAFYPLGAVEAAMLDSLGVPWRSAYRNAPFSIGTQLERACSWPACSG